MSKMLSTVGEDEISDSESGSSLRLSHGKRLADEEMPDCNLDAKLAKFEGISKKQKVPRELFPDSLPKDIVSSGVQSSKAVVEVGKTPSSIRTLSISEIGYTRERCAVEGKVLNLYGTYDSTKEYAKYLKTDLTDGRGFNTVTLIFGPNYYKSYVGKLAIDTCIRVEGFNVIARNPNDGGSIDYSLQVDATTCIDQIPFFESNLFFVPELSIRSYLAKVSLNSSLKTTIAFVIVQVDNIQKAEGGVFEQLTIADGPSPLDRATLTFVNKRKALYYRMVDEFHRGHIVPFIARNIGAWKERSNTLSILDFTLVAPLLGEKKKEKLELAFHAQIKSLGYGKEVVGKLHILNFNSTLIVKKCSSCKSQNINLAGDGAFCFSCGGNVTISEVVKLLGEILHSGVSTEVILSGEAADKVLAFEKPLLKFIKEEQGLARELLSEVEIEGIFVLDPHGQVIGFRPDKIAH